MLVPLGHGGVIPPSCATLGGLLLATRAIGVLTIAGGLLVIGAEAVIGIGIHGVAGDLIFVFTGIMFATFGTLLRLWGTSATPAAMVISVLALFAVPTHWVLRGFDHMIALGWRENLLQAVLQGVLAGPAAVYLFARAVHLLGAGRAAAFPSLVPTFVLLIGWLALGEATLRRNDPKRQRSRQITGLIFIYIRNEANKAFSAWLAYRSLCRKTKNERFGKSIFTR